MFRHELVANREDNSLVISFKLEGKRLFRRISGHENVTFHTGNNAAERIYRKSSDLIFHLIFCYLLITAVKSCLANFFITYEFAWTNLEI